MDLHRYSVIDITGQFAITNSDMEKNCIICGCTKHELFGCFTHWIRHKKNKEGRCETKDS
jgi:hypothetical protein